MARLIIGFIVGLIIGWNVLPQPQWAKNIWDKIMAKFRKKPEEAKPEVPEKPAE
jgi:hypothetical protein